MLPTQAWEADHTIALLNWPEHQPYPDALIKAAHKSCNRRSGGKDGARITNNKKRAIRNADKDIREW
ncbi:hypothetical protein [Curtobacterium sp. MCBA15_008]|uniref:hypothetical protein n=1 Tax=Curtobacterium sp. MCBA15_008 TaxID=1898736 RepID=UPI00111450B8|nr:hypothetical protein [Curtobacterium sp. MCBA15_008]